jgi:acyl-CoA-binding protein
MCICTLCCFKQLYGLFKYVTVSTNPPTSRPSIFDMTGRAKWDAWNMAGKTYVSGTDAEIRYLDIARDLGWSEGTALVITEKQENEQRDGEDIWDKDEDGGSNGSGGVGGMGNTVSTMAPPPEEIDGSIHGLAVSNDAVGITLFLEKYPDTDLNERDEFVRSVQVAELSDPSLTCAMIIRVIHPSIWLLIEGTSLLSRFC